MVLHPCVRTATFPQEQMRRWCSTLHQDSYSPPGANEAVVLLHPCVRTATAPKGASAAYLPLLWMCCCLGIQGVHHHPHHPLLSLNSYTITTAAAVAAAAAVNSRRLLAAPIRAINTPPAKCRACRSLLGLLSLLLPLLLCLLRLLQAGEC